MFLRFIQVVMWISMFFISFLLLNSIAVCGYTMFNPFITWWTFELFLVFAMNFHIHTFVWTYFYPLGRFLAVKLLSRIRLCLTFWKTTRLFSKVDVPFCIPISDAWLIVSIVCSLLYTHSNRYTQVYHYGFNLHFFYS